jgi:hypothetical protein
VGLPPAAAALERALGAARGRGAEARPRRGRGAAACARGSRAHACCRVQSDVNRNPKADPTQRQRHRSPTAEP